MNERKRKKKEQKKKKKQHHQLYKHHKDSGGNKISRAFLGVYRAFRVQRGTLSLHIKARPPFSPGRGRLPLRSCLNSWEAAAGRGRAGKSGYDGEGPGSVPSRGDMSKEEKTAHVDVTGQGSE